MKFDILVAKIFEDIESVFKLAQIANNKHTDLSKLNRSQYIDFAEDNDVYLDDNDLRLKPQLRTAIDQEHLQQILKSDNNIDDKNMQKFYHMSAEHQASPGKLLMPGIEIHPATLHDQMWLYYYINGGLDDDLQEIHKSYIGLSNINDFNAKDWLSFLKQLQNEMFCGNVKTAQDPKQLKMMSDQIVMHGNTKEDADIALRVAKRHFGDKVTFEDQGVDKFFNGKWYSHAQWLSLAHKNRLSVKRNFKN
jgi:hypothetical protein